MALQSINLGSGPDTSGGDTRYAAFVKVNSNFTEAGSRLSALEGGGGLAGIVTPEAHGSIGDGASHPLSSQYGSLAAAQAVYSFATSLTQQIDFCAVQAAINACAAAGGGTVHLGAKDYIMSASGGTATDTLVLPSALEHTEAGQMVNIVGVSTNASVLRWSRDLGTGKFAISCGDPTGSFANSLGRYSGSGYYAGLCSDFTLYGPNAIGTLGVAHTAMSGFAWGARRRLVRVKSLRFWAGFDFVGDHTLIQDITAAQCFHGLYWPRQSQFLYGDNLFVRAETHTNSMSCIGVHGDGKIGSTDFITATLNTSPYAIYKESGGSEIRIASACSFVSCMFEGMGNALVRDGNSTRAAGLEKCYFHSPFFLWDDTKILTGAGHGRTAVFDVNFLVGIDFIASKAWGSLWPTGSPTLPTAVFAVTGTLNGLFLRGQLDELFFNVPSGSIFSTNLGVDQYAGVGWEQDGARSSGTFAKANGAVTAGDLVEFTSFSVQRASSANLVPAGVSLLSATDGQSIPVCTRGRDISVKLESGTPTIGAPVRKGTAAGVQPATGPTDGWVVGAVLFNTSASVTRIFLRAPGP